MKSAQDVLSVEGLAGAGCGAGTDLPPSQVTHPTAQRVLGVSDGHTGALLSQEN